MIIQRVHKTIVDAGVAITGTSVDPSTSPPTVTVVPASLQAQAHAALANFDWTQAAEDAWVLAQEPDLTAIRNAATQAVNDINTYLAITSPTAAQVAAEVKAIDTRQRAVIKALLRVIVKMG